MDFLDQIVELFQGPGGKAYLGEPVSVSEHALQTAHLAQRAGAELPLVAAGLLHDIGHIIRPASNSAAIGIDGRHEEVGADWLSLKFGPEVTEPVRLHVLAKRYLAAVDPSSNQALSQASVRSLELQGGPMSSPEIAKFEMDPYYRSALQLRYWDDNAKVPGLIVPALEFYRAVLLACITPG